MKIGTQDHPECREGEVFLADFSRRHNDYKRIGYKTKRIGKVAYDVNGNIAEELVPIFVSKQEWDENEKEIKKMRRLRR